MSAGNSVTRWIDQWKAGDPSAAAGLWNRFYSRLIALACSKLRGAHRRAADEEDVVASVFETFFRRAQRGQFPQLHDRDDLWQLLVKITERKAVDQRRLQGRKKRGGGRLRGESVFLDPRGSTSGAGIGQIAGPEPTPEFAALVAEECERLLGRLADDELRQIAVLKLEGYTNEEIAERTGHSRPTIERRLRVIRVQWRGESD
jgi:DNA-directed RNA polymerase specialized sigma24 family protein